MANEVNLDIACKSVFGITTRRYRQLATDGIVPEVKNNQVDILAASKALIEYYKKLSQGQGSLSLTDERIRLTKINADRKQLQLERERGELLHAETAMRLWGNVCQKIRQKLLAIPVKLPPLVAGAKTVPQIKAKTENFIREVLNELANIDLRKNGTGAKDSGAKGIRDIKRSIKNIKAASASDGKPMGRRKKNTKSRGKRRARKVV